MSAGQGRQQGIDTKMYRGGGIFIPYIAFRDGFGKFMPIPSTLRNGKAKKSPESAMAMSEMGKSVA